MDVLPCFVARNGGGADERRVDRTPPHSFLFCFLHKPSPFFRFLLILPGDGSVRARWRPRRLRDTQHAEILPILGHEPRRDVFILHLHQGQPVGGAPAAQRHAGSRMMLRTNHDPKVLYLCPRRLALWCRSPDVRHFTEYKSSATTGGGRGEYMVSSQRPPPLPPTSRAVP